DFSRPLPVEETRTADSQPAPEPRRNLVIEAGAGTGKTTAIVAEVLRILLGDEALDPERIVLVTFTEKAAGEIADRIHEALAELELHFDDERVSWPIGSRHPLYVVPEERREAARRACTIQLARIDSLHSQTIHSFCQRLLRQFPIEAGLDPQFKVIEGFERSLLYGELYDAWVDRETRLHASPEALREWEVLLGHTGYLFFVRELIFDLLERRDLLMDNSYDAGGLDEAEPPILDALHAIRATPLGDDFVDEDARSVFTYIHDVTPPSTGSLDAWIDYFAPIAPSLLAADLPRKKHQTVLKEALLILRGGSSKGSSVYEYLSGHRAALALQALTVRFIEFLDAEKRTLGVVDFDDLLLRTSALLDDPVVLERVRRQYDYIFVDEFQDTDRVQAGIIDRLARDVSGAYVAGKTVLVGDPKQSIYGFRRADPETYHRMTERLVTGGADRQPLLDQYRSDPPLLDAVNALFSCLFPDGDHDPNVFRPPYRELRAGKTTTLRETDARITFLHAAHEEKSERFFAEAESVAEWIRLRRDGGEGDLRRFAILFRRTTNLDDYLDTLERYGIDYVLPPTRLFLDRRAPVDLLAVLRAVAYPFDRGAEVSAARTPYFALTDEEIASGMLVGKEAEGEEPEAAGPPSAWEQYRAVLLRYRHASANLTVAELIDLVVTTTGIESLYDASADGIRSQRHLEHVRAIAFDYDQKLGGSVRQFVDEIARRRNDPDEMEPSLIDETRNAVRIMTVHGAKGLEFETVILPDLAFPIRGLEIFTVEEPRSLVMTGMVQTLSANFRETPAGEKLKTIGSERERAEMRRLFYVAVTRAKSEVIFVCNTSEFKSMGFFSCLVDTFAFAKNEFPSLWSEGRTVRQLPVNGVAVPVAFEKVQPGVAGQRQRRRLVDTERERSLVEAPIAALSLQEPPAPAPRLSAQEAARGRAGGRHRQAGTLLHRVLERWDGRGQPDTLLRQLAVEAAA
ncbi:MAG: uncharacterized protein JWO56_1840, partial [Acidobacteria bacterium]|nr:uncharacterized protein [Acidobacteriota bacterium]